MFAVIPHSTEALILARTQKAALLRLNTEADEVCWVPAFPLWAFFNNFDHSALESGTIMQTDGNADTAFGVPQLKMLRSAIESFTIDVPEIANGEFFFPVILHFKNGDAARGKITAGTILADAMYGGKAADNTVNDTAAIPLERRSTRGGADFLRSDRCADNDKNSPEACSDTSPLRATEHEENPVGRFPYACRVFRIADAEIVCTLSTDSNDARKKIDRISAGDTNGVQLRTWRMYKSIWVKTEN